MRVAALCAALGLVLAACGSPPPLLSPRLGHLAVDVYGGLGGPAPQVPAPATRVEVVVDLTRSMLDPAAQGGTRADQARSRAAELLFSLREGTEIGLHALGHAPSDECTEPQRLLEPSVAPRREPVVQRLEELEPASEASLSAAIDGIRRDLERDGSARRTRVVVFSDLDDRCGGDLCWAARQLVATGAWLEVVKTGDAQAPSCLEGLLPTPTPPAQAVAGLPARPRVFRVEVAGGGGDSGTPLAFGYAGQGAVAVSPGLVTVFLDLDPPEEIGPFQLAPGEFARLRVLDAFDAQLPARIWRVERSRATAPRTGSSSDAARQGPPLDSEQGGTGQP